MELNWLRDFEILAACRNFSRAAEERHLSQPAFSRRIRSLENAVGAQLINRETLPLSLTPAGELFLDQARQMLHLYDETLERCQAVGASDESLVRFAASQSLYTSYYSAMIAPLMPEGGLSVDLNSASWPAQKFVNALQQGQSDVILTYWHPSMTFLAPLDTAQFEHLTVFRDEFIPVAKAGKDGRPVFALGGERRQKIKLLGYGSASVFRAVVDGILQAQITPPDTLVVSQSAQAGSVRAMIMEGFGLGWLPRRLCAQDLADGRLALAGPASFTTRLQVRLYRRRDNGKPPLTRLWNSLKDMAQAG